MKTSEEALEKNVEEARKQQEEIDRLNKEITRLKGENAKLEHPQQPETSSISDRAGSETNELSQPTNGQTSIEALTDLRTKLAQKEEEARKKQTEIERLETKLQQRQPLRPYRRSPD